MSCYYGDDQHTTDMLHAALILTVHPAPCHASNSFLQIPLTTKVAKDCVKMKGYETLQNLSSLLQPSLLQTPPFPSQLALLTKDACKEGRISQGLFPRKKRIHHPYSW
mmetsp:Transcript_8426/g.52692  ORF Transcript_8426/g.52692 Transcript_8426/m.52692 type:complete len:108 (-) Transcript_8426:161-484(-)